MRIRGVCQPRFVQFEVIHLFAQVAPLQRAMDAVEDQNHAPLGSFDPHLHEALEEWRMVEIKQAR